MATAQERDSPRDLTFDSIIVDVCFHPGKDVLACASIDGDVTIHSYSVKEDNHELMSLQHHKKACRAVRFFPDGNSLCTISKDKSIQVVDLDKGSVKNCIKKAHESAIYSLLIADQNIVATGDDDGSLKAWDLRQQKAVMDLKENEEYISGMILEKNKRILLATSGDGTLSAFDIRKHKMKMQSEIFDAEFLSLVPVKKEGKVVCGSGDGVLNIFNWGEWGNISDRFPGHPLSIDCMVPVTEDIICTGSIDGIIRAVNIHPNRLIGVVGEHEDFPIENLSKSHCGSFIASCSHDQKVKFWDIKELPNVEVDASKKSHKGKNLRLNAAVKKDDFFADMMEDKGDGVEEDDDDNEDSSDDDSFESSDNDDENAKTKENQNTTQEDSGVNEESDEELDDEDCDLDIDSDSDSDEDSEDSVSDSDINGKKEG